MDAGNITWVITLDQGTPKVEIVRKSSEKPVLECPSQQEMAPEWDSGIYLSKERGMRINMIRLIYTLGLMNYFRDEQGNKLPFNRIFHGFGKLLHADFSRYNNDLTRTMEENTSVEKQTEIFRLMIETFNARFQP